MRFFKKKFDLIVKQICQLFLLLKIKLKYVILTVPGTITDLFVITQTNVTLTCGWTSVQSATYYNVIVRNFNGIVQTNQVIDASR